MMAADTYGFKLRKGGLTLQKPVTYQKGQAVKSETTYHISLPMKARRIILRALIDERGDMLSIHRALVARRTLGKNRLNATLMKNITKDIEWLGKLLRARREQMT